MEAAGNEPVFSLLPFHIKKAAIVTTGSEVQKGLIKDTFTPVLKEKLFEYNVQMIGQTLPGDDRQTITSDILHFIEEGADLILCSGGMSVDPDDRTPGAIKDTVPISSPTEHRYFRVPCYCWHTITRMAKLFRSSDFRAA